MPPPSIVSPTGRKSDFLVSLVLADAAEGERYREVLIDLSARLDGAFQFWEIVVAVPETNPEASANFASTLRGLKNVRILRISTGNFYRRRLAGATEAIGDVVVLSSLYEIGVVDLAQLANDVYLKNEATTLVRRATGRHSSLFGSVLGALTGYRVVEHDTYTVGFPRSVLENILLRPDAEILLRFDPVSAMFAYKRVAAPPALSRPSPQHRRNWRRRLSLAGDMIVSASPRILRGIAFTALISAIVALAYGGYAIIVRVFRPVVEGWLTTSLLQSLTAFLLGISIAAISLGIVRVIDVLSNVERYAIVDEINNVDLVGSIEPTNVEVIATPTVSGQERK